LLFNGIVAMSYERLRFELAAIIQQFTRDDGLHESPIRGVYCVRRSHTDRRAKRQWRACLAIVVQGSKEVVLGGQVYLCDELYYTAAPVHLPVVSRITSAAANRPFLALLIELDAAILNELGSPKSKESKGRRRERRSEDFSQAEHMRKCWRRRFG
jgi:hypothetical protein